MLNDLDFIKGIVDNEVINIYYQLEQSEKVCSNDLSKCSYIETQYNQLLFCSELLNKINSELVSLRKENLILYFNNFIYKLKKLIRITVQSQELERAIIIYKKILNEEKNCLLVLRNKLSINYHNEDIPRISKIFLYYNSLITIKNSIVDNYIQQLTIDDSITKGFNVTYADEIDIDKSKESFEKIQVFINELIK